MVGNKFLYQETVSPENHSNNRGYTLLEVLFVVSVIAVIILFSIKQYYQMQRHSLVEQVNNDVQIIKSGLNSYFFRTGCNQNGTFSLMPSQAIQFQPSINDLNINTPSYYYTNHLPLVTAYSIYVIDSGQKNPTSGKPLYFLKVMANLNVTSQQVAWYKLQLNASGVSGNSIFWQSMPDNSYVQPNKNLWVLDGSRQLFRQSESAVDNTSAPISGSYCAN